MVQSLTLELEEARKAKKKAEQSAAIATASAAALVAGSVSSCFNVVGFANRFL